MSGPSYGGMRASGRFYTGEAVGRQLAASVAQAMTSSPHTGDTPIRVIDPFGGDGRLVAWLIQACAEQGIGTSWDVELWDLVDLGFGMAQHRMNTLRLAGIDVACKTRVGDAFAEGLSRAMRFDVVITNPPWEQLKPDRRELEGLKNGNEAAYVAAMRAYDDWLAIHYPLSQPRRKFAGWGTNLSRVGLELSLRLTRQAGILGAVMPASLLADDQSTELRRHLLTGHELLGVAYYPAEAKHYGTADVSSITLVTRAHALPAQAVLIKTAGANLGTETAEVQLDLQKLHASDYVLPVAFGAGAVRILGKLAGALPTWADLEAHESAGFWAGREVDETGSSQWLVKLPAGDAPFLKGRMIERFRVRQEPTHALGKPVWNPPPSMACERIAWRDVSRPNQKRRVIAMIVPAGWALGNSLGVACFAGRSPGALRALLGVMSSTVFEFQLRAHLATGHVSLSSLRKVAVPAFAELESDLGLQELVNEALRGSASAEVAVDAWVALNRYRLTVEEYETVLDLFQKLLPEERASRLKAYGELVKPGAPAPDDCVLSNAVALDDIAARPVTPRPVSRGIFNHFSARLSDLDLRMVRAVPEGGNWKDIPESIPSRRLQQIREGFARGEGSRSTYYGRLRRDMPSYTINTYFNRQGNGCHIHPTQDRVLSQREAARLQSFPDHFEFLGSQGSICNQIGNAVPPLLAFQIAQTLGRPGAFIDLFCGAGGMGLGFSWAAWRPVIANDMEPRFVETYRRNVHDRAVAGSITDQRTVELLVEAAAAARRPGEPLWVLGGPPCQGFSTAGNKRTMVDPRNHLVWDYVRFLERVRPDGFVFENVTGLLNMQGGSVFAAVKEAFASVMPSLQGAVVSTDDYAIPQRRKRVILVGHHEAGCSWAAPRTVTSTSPAHSSLLHSVGPAVSVEEALADLPPLAPGENGSHKEYISQPRTPFQALMRGDLTPHEYLRMVSVGVRLLPVGRIAHDLPGVSFSGPLGLRCKT